VRIIDDCIPEDFMTELTNGIYHSNIN